LQGDAREIADGLHRFKPDGEARGFTMSKHSTPKRRKPTPAATPTHDHKAILARRLEVLAGCELQHGHHAAAERLAWRAAALREAGQ